MHFIQFEYLFVFLPVVVILYSIFRTSPFANFIIMAASYYFYGSSGLLFLAPLIFTSVLDFVVAQRMQASDNETTRRILLIVSIVANLGLLFFFKYTTWLSTGANQLFAHFGLAFSIPVLAVTLPPGISFYTFQTMSYTIEIYRREMKARNTLVNYMAFVTFWPHLVAGPILRASNLLAQLERIRPVISADVFRWAIMLIAWGLAKKLVLADNFGQKIGRASCRERV